MTLLGLIHPHSRLFQSPPSAGVVYFIALHFIAEGVLIERAS